MLTQSQTTSYRLSRAKRFADGIFKSVTNGREFSKWVENTVGKGEIARYEQFLLFPQYFPDVLKDTQKPGLVW